MNIAYSYSKPDRVLYVGCSKYDVRYCEVGRKEAWQERQKDISTKWTRSESFLCFYLYISTCNAVC